MSTVTAHAPGAAISNMATAIAENDQDRKILIPPYPLLLMSRFPRLPPLCRTFLSVVTSLKGHPVLMKSKRCAIV